MIVIGLGSFDYFLAVSLFSCIENLAYIVINTSRWYLL